MAATEPDPDLLAPTPTGGHLIGYARTSRRNQILDRQTAALSAVGCKRIYRDQLSGKDTARLIGVNRATLYAHVPELHNRHHAALPTTRADQAHRNAQSR